MLLEQAYLRALADLLEPIDDFTDHDGGRGSI
jgi:hypothetical protein